MYIFLLLLMPMESCLPVPLLCHYLGVQISSSILIFQKELQNLEDAGDELMMAEDDSLPVPYP